ncbi:hypothetical protein BKA56DRAFT_611050 [Ilyonectria sp. MPI-CAGE-AT-0026]|nr:hypothetical protein BKA56DRAFT_611050 [Ilyonectria sp. MPI-CAGE-AT-0026]
MVAPVNLSTRNPGKGGPEVVAVGFGLLGLSVACRLRGMYGDSDDLMVSNSELPVALFSNYEDHLTLEPLMLNPLEELQLTTLFASITGTCDDTLILDPPKGIPNVITAAGFRADDQGSIFVSGTLSNWRHEVDRSKAPTISFQKVSLEARWNWVQKIVWADLYFWLRLKSPPGDGAQKSKTLTAPPTRPITGEGREWDLQWRTSNAGSR